MRKGANGKKNLRKVVAEIVYWPTPAINEKAVGMKYRWAEGKLKGKRENGKGRNGLIPD
jgi:hypothetical protein